jgi:hypothetical protein
MASKNIKIRRRTAAGLDILYPETKKEQIRASEGVDISAQAENLLGLGLPSTTPKYFKIDSSGNITYGDDAAFIGASPEEHSHVIADFGPEHPEEPSLQEMLNAKVPLVSGKIPAEYWPSWTKGHMKFISAVSLTGETPIPLLTILGYLTTQATPDLDIGNYLIVNTPGRVSTSAVEPYTTLLGADDGEITNPYLENGDWIILVGYEADPVSYIFALVSNQHDAASTSKTGIVQLASATGKTKRSDLDTGGGNTKVVTEAILRGVLKNIELVDIWDFGGGATTKVDRVIPTGLTHTSGDVTSPISGSIGEFVVVADNARIYEMTAAGSPNNTWTYRGILSNYPSGGFTQARLYWWPTLNHLRYALNALADNTSLPIYPADENDIFFEE